MEVFQGAICRAMPNMDRGGAAARSERKINVIGSGEDKIISKVRFCCTQPQLENIRLTVDSRGFISCITIGVAVHAGIHRSQHCKCNCLGLIRRQTGWLLP